MVVKTIPSPAVAQQGRIRRLLHDPSQALRDLHKTPISNRPSNSLWGKVEAVVADLESCRAGDAEVIVFVSKMVPVRVSELRAADVAILNRELRSKDASAIDLDPVSGEVMMAMGRVFSGVLRRESKLMVLSPRHDPLGDLLRRQSSELSSIDAEKLDNILPSISSPDFLSLPCTPLPAEALGIYLCFGPSVMPVDEVPAGNIVGIVGIADHVLKTGALSSTWLSPTMEAMTFQAKPIVRVAVEPLNYFDLHKLEAGLKLLYQYDPAVDIGVDTTSGQHTMACLGEIHQVTSFSLFVNVM